MTDDNLEDELRATLAAVADSYVPTSATPEPAATRLPVVPLIVAAAAALLVVAGLSAMLTDDQAADVDISNSTTSADPAPTTTPTVPTTDAREPSMSDGPVELGIDSDLARWTWTLGSPAPRTIQAPVLIWATDEVAVVRGGPEERARDGLAYSPTQDAWRALPSIEAEVAWRVSSDPAYREIAGIVDPEPAPELDNIIVGTVDDGERAVWTLTGPRSVGVVLPPLPTRQPILGGPAPAVWTGQELVVWLGSNCLSDECGQPGPLTPFVLRPPAEPVAAPQPADLADIARSVWVLYGIERDGERLDNNAAGTITATIETTGASSYRLTGWAGCDYAADVRSEGARLVWTAPVNDCAGDTSPFARAFRASLTEASSASTVDQWPTPFLYLDGDGLRLLFVPATDNTVPGPTPTTDTVPAATTPNPALTAAWTLTSPPYTVLESSITVDTGTELITIGHVPGDPGFPGEMVGHGFNPILGLWREIAPQPAMMNNRLDNATWTGAALAAYLDGSGVSELVTYDPATNAWTWVAGWDFTRSYPLTVMEMRDGELYLQSGDTLLTWLENGGGHWTIIRDSGDPSTPHAAVQAEVETLWARIGDLNVEQPDWQRSVTSLDWGTKTISYRIDPAFHPPDGAPMVTFVAAARDTAAAFILERNLTDTVDELLVITFDYDSDPATE